MGTQEAKVIKFKEVCKMYLMGKGLVELRSYGRLLELARPTCYAKADLVNAIVGVLCGEVHTQRTKCGAPIKNNLDCMEIVSNIEQIRERILGKRTEKPLEEKSILVEEKIDDKETRCFQLQVSIEQLNYEQKELLKRFINSL